MPSTKLRYHFARLAGFLDHAPDPDLLQERRDHYSKQMLFCLAIELYVRGCRLHAITKPGAGLPDYSEPDSDGHLSFWVAHRDRPNLQFGFSVQVEWNNALETIGHCATFKIESWSTRKRDLFYFRDVDAKDLPKSDDISDIADFVSAGAIDAVRRYPRPKP